jgi:hypothetical protein
VPTRLLDSPGSARSTSQPDRSLRIVAIAGLFLLLLLAACRLLLKEAWHGRAFEENVHLLWTAATLGFNYPEFGLVKRGLGGTIVYFTGLPQLAGTVVFHALSAAALAAVACRFMVAMSGPLRARIAHPLVLLVFMLFWAEDPGRTDMAIAALVGVATLAILGGRPLLAAVVLAISLAMHENGFIFGIPLVAMLLFEHRRPATLSRRGLAASATVLLATIAFYLLMDRLPHADNATMTALVQSRLPPHMLVDWAVYFAIAGTRGLRTAMCHNAAMGGMYGVHLVCGILEIVFVTFILAPRNRRAWVRALAVSLPPYLFLCLVGNDIARWAVLAGFNVWLSTACERASDAGPRHRSVLLTVLLAATLLVFTHPRRPFTVDLTVFSPSPPIEVLAMKLGVAPTVHLEATDPPCDPAWREVLQMRAR